MTLKTSGFQLWHGKHLKLKSPSLQERKDPEHTENKWLPETIKELKSQGKTHSQIWVTGKYRTTAQICLPEMDDAGAQTGKST